jgi:hypothetical protein
MRNYEILVLFTILLLLLWLAKLERSAAARHKDRKQQDCEVTVPDDCNTLLLMINSHDVNIKTAAFRKLKTLLPELVVNQASSISNETVTRMRTALLQAIADGCNFIGANVDAVSVFNAICFHLTKTEIDEDRKLVTEFKHVLVLNRERGHSPYTIKGSGVRSEYLVGKKIVLYMHDDPSITVLVGSVFSDTPAIYTYTNDPDELLQLQRERATDLIIAGPYTANALIDARVLIQKIAAVNSQVPVLLLLKVKSNDDRSALGTLPNVMCYLTLPFNPLELLSFTSRILKDQLTSSDPETNHRDPDNPRA